MSDDDTVKPSDEWLTLAEVVSECKGRLSESTLRRYIRNGMIEVSQPGGRKGKLFIRGDTVFRLRERPRSGQTSDTTPEPGDAAPCPKTTIPRWMRGG